MKKLASILLATAFVLHGYQSDIVVQKPIFLKPKTFYLKDWQISSNSVHKAYDHDGATKDFLAYAKPDTLLTSFFDDGGVLPANDTSSYAQIAVKNTHASTSHMHFTVSYAIDEHFYVDASFAADDWKVYGFTYDLKNEHFDDDEQEDLFKKYLNYHFQNYKDRGSLYSSFSPRLNVGYNYLFDDMRIIDFVHGNLQIGVQGVSDVTFRARDFIQLPNVVNTQVSGNIAHGIDIGCTDWLTIGSSQTLMIFFPKSVVIPFNAGAPDNAIMFDNFITGTLGTLPNLDLALYARIGKPSWRVRGCMGYVFQHGFGSWSLKNVTATDPLNIPTDVARLLATDRFAAWSLGSGFFDLDFIVLRNEEREQELVINLGLQFAMHGKNAFARDGGKLGIGLYWTHEF